jgi:hypothetical protein
MARKGNRRGLFGGFLSVWKSVGILGRFESLIYEKFRKT